MQNNKFYSLRIISILLLLVLATSLLSCDSSNEIKTPDALSNKFTVIFFDIENSSDGNTHYDVVGSNGDQGASAVYPAECYMIKCEDIEIVVDGGFQLNSAIERISNVYQNNVINKINQHCTDGIIEYLIVTHGDFDHIAGLAVDGGLLDYVATTDMKINTIIDFDSDLVEYLSNSEKNEITSPANKFFESINTINLYRTKRDNLVKTENTIHVPAALLFKGYDLEKNILVNAMPDSMLKNYFKGNGSINGMRLLNFYYFSDTYIIQQIDYNGEKIVRNEIPFTSKYENVMFTEGELKHVTVQNSESDQDTERYYYSIPLGTNSELRILYNWYYDHFYKHSFNSQNRNNISVCFEIVCGEKKFVAFGDLGGDGESGIINYYKDTEILKNVSCFKASHHGSTTNGENSQKLFELTTPDVVIITGLLQNPDYAATNAVPLTPQLIDNIKSGINSAIYCTQIAKKVSYGGYISAPLCGDITVSIGAGEKPKVKVSYNEEVEGYLSSEQEHFKFQNFDGNEIKSLEETEYWKTLYKGD